MKKILTIALVVSYALAVGFSAVSEVRASQFFAGSGSSDGPDHPSFDILTMPCPFCGVTGKMVKIDDYKGLPGNYYYCINCKTIMQIEKL